MDSTTATLPWLASYDPGVPPRLDYPPVPLFALLRESIRQHGERTALVFYGKKISYGQLGNLVDRLAGALHRLGAGPGDRVALLLPNCPQYVIAYFAVLQLGAVVVPVNPLSTERELAQIVRDAGVRLAVALDLTAGRLENVRHTLRSGDSPLLEQVVYAPMAEFLPRPLAWFYRWKQKAPSCRGPGFLSLVKNSRALQQAASPDVRRDPALLVYTGGTTGSPKGIVLSHYALVVNACQCKTWAATLPEDRFLAVLPLFHGFGMSVGMNSALLAGASLILLPRFSPGEVLKTIRRRRPTLFAGVPSMFTALVNHPGLNRRDLSSLRGCFVGAASLPPEIKRRFTELTGGRLMEGYGLTEAVTAKCANPYRGVNKTGSIGIPFPDTVMRIVDFDTGTRELPPGEVGEIVLKSPDLMLGYHRRPEETAQSLRDGWLYTGDLGYMDPEGYFYIVDRKKDLIITGGFNVYPREVEDVLYLHPAVKEACIVGVPDGYRGEAVKAFVVLKENMTAGADDLIAFCRQNLLPYKVPRQVEFCPDLPKSAVGKVLRRILKERGAG